METKIITVNGPEDPGIQLAAEALRRGETVVFPTETVYGLGADGRSEETVKKIFQAKGRPGDNPLILHIAEEDQVHLLARDLSQQARDCMSMFWPGPLTLILHKREGVPDAVTAGLDTVAVRMPSHRIARELLKAAKIPVAAPSANLSGKPSPTNVRHVMEDLQGRVDMILDGGSTDVGIESTVLDLTVDPPMVLRPGSVTVEDLQVLLGKVDVDRSSIEAKSPETPRSPGQKYRHYAPKAECILFAGNLKNVAKEINRRSREDRGIKTAILATEETLDLYEDAPLVLSMGTREDLTTVSRNLFDLLRRCDEEGVDRIFVEGFDFDGIGAGIMNRLLKACGGKVVLGL